MRVRILIGILACLAGAACGSSPTSPSDASISGTWSGPSGSQFVTVTFNQNGGSLQGTWSTSPVINGGQLTGSKTGAGVQMTLSPSNPQNCPYTITATLSTATAMSGTYASFNCTVAISGSISLNKQ
jgi:hypothetical protein